MFFNFTVCVLPPLITCAALYFVIFLSLIRTKQPSDKLYDQQKHEKIFNSRTPIMLHRYSSLALDFLAKFLCLKITKFCLIFVWPVIIQLT